MSAHFDALATQLHQRLAPTLPGVYVGVAAVSLVVYVPRSTRIPRGTIPRSVDGVAVTVERVGVAVTT